MDTELFELCANVFKKTLWKDTDHYIISRRLENGELHYAEHFEGKRDSDSTYECPLYTSDYLLERLREAGLGRVVTGFSKGFQIAFANYSSALDEDMDTETKANTLSKPS